eukprot:TRINITY_DN18023_c0_g1_i1.p1 TRINITY_DN18023_c0_g1~~TRINITY_DN18023_c0_g1_i1.p1  ORF type:complete len:263 (-),score=46.62 TRINITY_DN18023_c0_g1_i1:416-1204(-)
MASAAALSQTGTLLRANLCRSQASPRPSLRSSFVPTLPKARSQHRKPQRNVVTCGLEGGNLFLELIGSVAAGAVVAGVTIATSENREAEFERVKTVEGAIPLAAAVGADAVAHSLPGLNVLLSLLSEPAGAAAGVAYLMSIVLSSPSVDPKTLAPEGTVLDAKKAADIRGAVRVPFTRIGPTALSVIDYENEGSSGKGWSQDGLPKLPITSVAIVLGVGGVLLELISHAPVLGIFMPRVLQIAGWLALLGAVLDKREDSVKA